MHEPELVMERFHKEEEKQSDPKCQTSTYKNVRKQCLTDTAIPPRFCHQYSPCKGHKSTCFPSYASSLKETCAMLLQIEMRQQSLILVAHMSPTFFPLRELILREVCKIGQAKRKFMKFAKRIHPGCLQWDSNPPQLGCSDLTIFTISAIGFLEKMLEKNRE